MYFRFFFFLRLQITVGFKNMINEPFCVVFGKVKMLKYVRQGEFQGKWHTARQK